MAGVDAEMSEMFATIPDDNRVLVTNHDSLGYLALRYDFEVIGTVLPGGTTLGDPSSDELASLVSTMQEYGATAVFAETTSPSALAEAIAAELGEDVEVVELYTGSLGEPGSGADTLAGMLLTDAKRITDALTGSG